MNFNFRKSAKVDFNQAFSHKINPRLREISYDTIKEIQETFEIFDSEKNGCMKLDDLKIALMSLGLKTSNDEFQRFVKQFKLNNVEKDFLNYQEFYEIASMRLVILKLIFS
jgi:Ca2+-binding EF-hand superfamily protein